MKNIMKKAHEMTKEIKKEFPNIDYKFQLGLCLSFLYHNEGVEEEMVELKGSAKQVAWAEDIRNKFITDLNEIIKGWKERYQKTHKKSANYAYENAVVFKEIISNNDSASWFINNRYFNIENIMNHSGAEIVKLKNQKRAEGKKIA